jgi:hypothetical protein
MKTIYDILDNHFENYDYKLILSNKETFKLLVSDFIVQMLETDLKFIDITLSLHKKYNISIQYNQTVYDFYQHFGKMLANYFESMNEEKIKLRYTDDYSAVEERMFFRMELYKFGWKPPQIENYIYKYLLKRKEKLNFNNSTQLQLYYNLYHNTSIKLNLVINKRINERKVGRPKLPNELKNYLKKKHLTKVRENMKHTYEGYKEYKNLKNNLLTQDEYELLVKSIEDYTKLKKEKMNYCNNDNDDSNNNNNNNNNNNDDSNNKLKNVIEKIKQFTF